MADGNLEGVLLEGYGERKVRGGAAGYDAPCTFPRVGFWIVMGPARERVRQSGDSFV